MTLQARALARHSANLNATAGVAVSYSQGLTTIDDLTATPSQTTRLAIDDEGAETLVNSTDWLVLASDLEGLSPNRHDIIEYTDDDDVVHTYEVLPIVGEDVFHRADPLGVILRIHSKLVSQA